MSKGKKKRPWSELETLRFKVAYLEKELGLQLDSELDEGVRYREALGKWLEGMSK